MSSTRAVAAPEDLEVLRRFINTRDIEAGTDSIDGPAAAQRWFAEAGLWRGESVADSAAISKQEVQWVHRFRESLREAAMANHDDRPLPDDVVDVLNDTAARAGLSWFIGSDRQWTMTPAAGGAAGAMGRLVSVMSAAMTQGTWYRLRACTSDTCRWAFYDNSRAGTAKWCSMKLCGNRAKQQAWRVRNKQV